MEKELENHDSSCEEEEDDAKYDDFIENPAIVDKYKAASFICKGTTIYQMQSSMLSPNARKALILRQYALMVTFILRNSAKKSTLEKSLNT